MWIADPFTDSGLGQVVIACASAIGAGLVLFKPLRAVWRLAKGLDRLLTDWHGEPARDGVDKRDGVMARLAVVEKRTSQLVTNGGSSLHDKVNNLIADLRIVKSITGEAATAASIAQEVGRHAELMLEQQSAELIRHVEESHLREQTYLAMLHELGIDLDLPGTDGTD